MFNHKGYLGSVFCSETDACLWGKLEHINATITYEGQTVEELRNAFIEAVEDYLATCEAQGWTPEKPCKGTFNVRTQPEIHQQLVMAAKARGEKATLNEIANEAFSQYLANNPIPTSTPTTVKERANA